jgi:hypothetical protein
MADHDEQNWLIAVQGKILSVLTRFRLPRADTEDLVSQTNQKLLQAHPHSENLNSYAATAARNVYRDHVRSLYPQLTALQSQLKAAFEQLAEYAVWTERKRSVCGRSEWHGRPPGFTRARLMSAHRDSELPVMKLPAAKENAQWARLFDAIFLAFPAPLRLNDLTVFLAAHFGLDRQRFVPPGDTANRLETSLSPAPSAEQSVLDRETVALAWEAIQNMQRNHRLVFLLGLSAQTIEAFPCARVASLDQIGASLGLSEEEFALLLPVRSPPELRIYALVEAIPIPDALLSRLLGVDPKLKPHYVSNLRQTARDQIRRKIILGSTKGAGQG